MAIFYSDNPTLSLATAIYTDAGLTTKAADGYYSDQTISRRQDGGFLLAAQACANCSANPATSTLTFSSYDGGVSPNSRFYFMLSTPLVTNNITIESAQIEAFDSAGCFTTPVGGDSLANPLVILSGANNANGAGNGLNCASTGAIRYKRFNSFVVNGESVYNGSIVNIGGCLVTIAIDNATCESLSCNS